MSAALQPEVVDPQQFTPLDDYQFSGNDVTLVNKRLLIENLRRKAVIYLAAKAVGINKLTVYRWRDSDPQFAAAMREAMEDAKEVMENSIYEDALNGNTLLKMFWLKRHDPAYRDRMTIDVSAVDAEIQERLKELQGIGESMPNAPLPADLQKEVRQLPSTTTPTDDDSR